MAEKKDNLYAASVANPGKFEFSAEVANVFQDMIERSVPGYELVLAMIKVLASEFARPDTNCYDLGCSLGAGTLCLRDSIPYSSCRIIAIDNAPAMVDRCRGNIEADTASVSTEVICQDIRETVIENASMVLMNFTLQFIQREDRAKLLAGIASGLKPGGVLVLSEKLKMADFGEQEILTHLHHGFKRDMGYSDLEISQKRSALEDVLVPDSFENHKHMLLEAGFGRVYLWFQCFTFGSMIALK